MAQLQQQPGRVTRQGIVEVSFKFGGPQGLLNKRNQEFYADLRRVVLFAGYAGEFTLIALNNVRGSEHTKGLLIGNPARGGVEIYEQYRDNGSRVRWMLAAPRNERPEFFASKLKAACAAIDADEQGEEESSPPSDVVSATQTVTRRTVTTEQVETRVVHAAHRGLDPELLPLFFELLWGQAAPDGLVPKKVCRAILYRERLAQSTGVGSRLKGLITDGYLKPVPGNEAVLQIVFPRPIKQETQAPSAPAQVLPVAQKPAVPVTPSVASSAPRVFHAVTSVSDPVLEALVKLRRDASATVRLRAELEATSRLLDRVSKQIEDLQGERASLESKKATIKRQLDELPQVADAAERLAQVQKLLGV